MEERERRVIASMNNPALLQHGQPELWRAVRHDPRKEKLIDEGKVKLRVRYELWLTAATRRAVRLDTIVSHELTIQKRDYSKKRKRAAAADAASTTSNGTLPPQSAAAPSVCAASATLQANLLLPGGLAIGGGAPPSAPPLGFFAALNGPR